MEKLEVERHIEKGGMYMEMRSRSGVGSRRVWRD
jgi:hypothetical protein